MHFDKSDDSIGSTQDNSERKQTIKDLEESNKHYFELAENAPIGIIRCDISGNIIYANQNAADTLGSPSVEETKKVNLLSFPLLIKHGFSKKLEQCLRCNETIVDELRYESKWGRQVWLRTHIKSWVDHDVITGAQVIIDDISEKKYLEEELRKLAITDYLTNTYNRRQFINELESEIERSKRYKSFFSLIMFDLDHFKDVNDSFGHQAGDTLLKCIAEVVQNRIRKIDCFARWGGEEFVIMIPGTPTDQAIILAEELRIKISALNLPGIGRTTASFGVTEFRQNDTVDTLIQKADDLMYAAKARGRNQVAVASCGHDAPSA